MTSSEHLYPSPSSSAAPFDARIRTVTLLEDRAHVRREGKAKLVLGQNRLLVMGVAPVLQDVSLKADSTLGRVVDVRVRRAVRVRKIDKPDFARALEEKIHDLHVLGREAIEDREREEARYQRVLTLIDKAREELPIDAGWGMVNQQLWHDAFEGLFKKARALRSTILDRHFVAEEAVEDIRVAAAERGALDRPDTQFIAWIELDVVLEKSPEGLRGSGQSPEGLRGSGQSPEDDGVDVAIEYVVPNALWRPMHSARLLSASKLQFSSSAVVWQNTGEDWTDAELVFSTARSSLGTEPPFLQDDLLTAQKKNDQVIIASREVAVQRASEGGRPQTTAIELPGVDDGGEIRTLKALARRNVPSDGRPNIVPLFVFEAEPETSLVGFPELATKVFLKSVQPNGAKYPILAGPVELVRDNGFVGWTQVLFVAPKEKFSLSFGPDDDVRIERQEYQSSEVNHVDKWTELTKVTTLYLSNLSGDEKSMLITERVPTSEIEQVKVVVKPDKKNGLKGPDENGFVRYEVKLAGNAQQVLTLSHTIKTAPGVQQA